MLIVDEKPGVGPVRLGAIKPNCSGKVTGARRDVENYATRLGIKTLYVKPGPEAIGYHEQFGWKLDIGAKLNLSASLQTAAA